jgi:lysyl-tRNA synthetase, class II
MEEGHEQFQLRKQKLSYLREKGINPYPYTYDKKNNATDILEEFSKLKNHEKTSKKRKVAGRILTFRKMGKVSFLTIQDQTGKLQLYASEEKLGKEVYKILTKFDLGDIIGTEGTVFRTKRGEITLEIKTYELLSKSLRPLPSKWHGLKDDEIKYRQRYVDFIVNQNVKDVFLKRDKIMRLTRDYLSKRGFIETDVPTLQTIYGGAKARPFKTHINAWDIDLFLSISPELYLKRLLVGGFEKVYFLGKSFRNEGVDRTHNPEFTMLELYWAYKDYNDIMKLTEELISFLAKEVTGSTKVEYQGKSIDFKTPWKRMTMREAIKKYGKIDVDKLSDSEIKKLLKKYKIEQAKFSRGWAINDLFEELVEEKLVQPTFITDYPKETSPLCKEKRGDSKLIERFEFFFNGHEVGNAYSELNDPLIQNELLKDQEKQRKGGDDEANPMDKDFVRALEYGMPPAGGLGVGIDRVIMLLTNSKSLRDVILFPIMRPEK